MSYRGAGNYSNTTSSSVQLAVAGNGRMSNLITARNLLFKQNDMVRAKKRRAGMANTNMTLLEYKFTHHCFLNDSFKPTALITNDQVVMNPTGPTNYDDVVEFLLNEIGDFMTNITAVVDFPDVKCIEADLPNIVVYSKYKSVNDANGGRPLDFGAGALGLVGAAASIPDGHAYIMNGVNPQNTPFVNDDGLNYVIAPGGIRYTYVDSNGALLAGPDGTQVEPNANGFGQGAQNPRLKRANHVRAVRFPGIRLFDEQNFLVDEKPIQEYDPIAVLNETLYKTNNDVKPLLYELYGENIGHYEKNHLVTQLDKSFGNITGPNALASTSHNIHVFDGLQTPKASHKAQQLLIPTPFTFSTDISKALCMAALPDTPKKIQYKTTTLDHIFRPTFGNLFIREEITADPADALGVAIPSTAFNRTLRLRRDIPCLIADSYIERDCCKNLQMRLLGTCLYTDDILHDMFVSKVGFNMIRLPVIQKKPMCMDCTCDSYEDVQLYGSRWPTEWIVPRLIPQINRKKESIHYPDNWFEDAHICNYLEYFHDATLSQTGVAPNISYFHDIRTLRTDIRSRKIPTLKSLGLRVLAYDFFNKQNIQYYRYLHTYNRGVNHFQAGFHERQAPFISFQYNLFDDQVDNVCNFSKARESYLVIGANHHGYSNCNNCVTTSPCYVEQCCDKNAFYLHIHMSSLNFTVQVAGTFVIRYS